MRKLANTPLTNEDHQMVFSNHFGIHFLPTGAGSAPSNDFGMILTCACQFAFAGIFAMLGCLAPFPLSILCWLCVGLILFFRFATIFMFASAVFAGNYTNKFYRSSIAFWGWWPFWLCSSTVVATLVGTMIGSYLWSFQLEPYYELKKLQMYKDVNPQTVPGERIQDAGLVDFTQFVEMDRGKGGCFMNKGNTYCVAPIVNGGEVKYGTHGTPDTGSYDYFAVGINCCMCPNRDFQCGEWRNPLANGGMRSLDYKSRPYYKLALDDWQASYGKTAKNPLFFEWVQGPEWKWKGLWNRFLQIFWLSVAGAISVGLSVGFVLDKVLQVLWQRDVISPRACIAPAPYMESVTRLLLPKMFYRYQQEQADIATMPVGDDWRPERGPGSAAEDKRIARDNAPNYGGMGASSLNTLMAPPGARPNPMASTIGMY